MFFWLKKKSISDKLFFLYLIYKIYMKGKFLMKNKVLNFKKLTPTNDADISIYKEAIDYSFENDDINNIAVSGSYGSGKSSIFESYKSNNPDKSFIHISLANFKTDNKSNDKPNNKPDDEPNNNHDNKNDDPSDKVVTQIEGKIINQLIHQIPTEKIPQTIFRTKEETTKTSLIKCTALVVIILLCFAHMILAELWIGFVNTFSSQSILKPVLAVLTTPYSFLISGIVAIALSSLLIYKLIQIQKNKRVLKKLSVQGNEVEIFENTDDSYFDKYLNEVLYLFKSADVDAIVFEDLDRFEGGHIFARLREINNLVNLQLKKNEKTLKFFYLLRDDIFSSKERTKFFDYIIPIVPVVNSSNSYNQIKASLKENNVFDKFDDMFLKKLSLYIDDMRVLKNICNEFLVYYYKLNTIELDINKMFAIITYKNLFPKDFSDLQFNKGFLYFLFRNKERFIAEQIQDYQFDIAKKKSEYEKIKSEYATTNRELLAIFVDKYFKNSSGLSKKSDEDLETYICSYFNDSQRKEFNERKEKLTSEEEGRLVELSEDIVYLESKISETRELSLAELITKKLEENHFCEIIANLDGNQNYKEIYENEYFYSIQFLVCNGFIDETYTDYLTYFYDNSLSFSDKIFLRSITDRKAKAYNYPIKNPELVLSYLKESNFKQKEARNYDMLTYLLNNQKLKFIREIINSEFNMKEFDFLNKYFMVLVEHTENGTDQSLKTETMKEFINCLYLIWSSYFSDSISNDPNNQDLYVLSIFTPYNISDDLLKNANDKNCLAEFISNSPDYLNITNPQIDTLINAFKKLGVSFRKINFNLSDRDLFAEVYKNSLYDINIDNIKLMLNVVFYYDNEKDIKHKNYSLIFSNPESELNCYIRKNISKYIDVILENCDESVCDDELAALEIINDASVSKEQKLKYISYLSTKIEFISLISDVSLWETIVSRKLIYFHEENILLYFNKTQKMDSVLVEYLNSTSEKIDFSKIRDEECVALYKKIKGKLFDECISCNELEDDRYIQILSSIGFCEPEFGVENLSESKIDLLIDDKIICMDLESLEFIRKNFPKLIIKFISKYIEEYIGIIDSNSFSYNELIALLNSDIDEKHKISLIDLCDSPISILNKGYSEKVEKHILENNLDEDEMEDLYKNYDSQKSNTKQFIDNYATQNIDTIHDNSLIISVTLFEKLISSNIDKLEKVQLFVNMISVLNQTDAIKCLNTMGVSEYTKIFDMSIRPRFVVDEISELLLDAFKSRQWITDYNRNKNYYTIERKRHYRRTGNK